MVAVGEIRRRGVFGCEAGVLEVAIWIVGRGVGIVGGGVVEGVLRDHDCCIFRLCGRLVARSLDGEVGLTINMPSYQLSSVQRCGMPVGTLR